MYGSHGGDVVSIQDASALLYVNLSWILQVVGCLIPAGREVIIKYQVKERSEDATLGEANIASGELSLESTSTYWLLS